MLLAPRRSNRRHRRHHLLLLAPSAPRIEQLQAAAFLEPTSSQSDRHLARVNLEQWQPFKLTLLVWSLTVLILFYLYHPLASPYHIKY
uniref:Uncharacterized protein n=1 Tax=Kalanchoe fedtschenkoi TaxID=63787 RepID=A0A7N0T2M1_KALFE